LTHQAFIDASGGNASGGAGIGGSGGAIKLVAPAITGPMNMNVTSRGNWGGFGRVRLDALNFGGTDFSQVNPVASLSYGSMLATGIGTNAPSLAIIAAAGATIAPAAPFPATIILPNGSATNQTITVQASNFFTKVPINVVLTPDNGPTLTFPATIDNTTANPATVVVNVVVPANTPVRVGAWTR